MDLSWGRYGRLLPVIPLPRPFDPSRSESTRGSALFARSDECGPAVVFPRPPVNPAATGSRGKGLLVSTVSFAPDEPVSELEGAAPGTPDLMLAVVAPSSYADDGLSDRAVGSS